MSAGGKVEYISPPFLPQYLHTSATLEMDYKSSYKINEHHDEEETLRRRKGGKFYTEVVGMLDAVQVRC